MQLLLLSLNVWGLPWPVSRIPMERMQMIAADLPRLEVDAAAFQEAWLPSARDVLLEGGRRAGLVHAWYKDRVMGSSGLLVLSRWPILDSAFTPFALRGLPQRVQHADWFGRKGFVRCRLDLPVGELDLFATHLQATYGRVGYADEYLGHRMAQMIELAHAIALSDRPLVVLGDLNARPQRDEMALLFGATGVVDVAVAIGRDAPTLRPYSPYSPDDTLPGKRIDYALARAGTRVGIRPVEARRTFDTDFVLGGERATFSDHAGVLAELDVGGAGRPLPAPVPHTLDRARRALDHGRRAARRRRDEQRVLAASSALLAGGSAMTAHYTRRQWLRRTGFAIAALSALPAAGWLGLAEGFAPAELEGYRQVGALLDDLAELADERDRRAR
jgi:endonuclease/exonuclease/phosphatase family metal-dependent hydrolase